MFGKGWKVPHPHSPWGEGVLVCEPLLRHAMLAKSVCQYYNRVHYWSFCTCQHLLIRLVLYCVWAGLGVVCEIEIRQRWIR